MWVVEKRLLKAHCARGVDTIVKVVLVMILAVNVLICAPGTSLINSMICGRDSKIQHASWFHPLYIALQDPI